MKDEELEEQGRVAPNLGAGGSQTQAISDLAESEEKGEVEESEQQRNEEKEEILKLLRGWQQRKRAPSSDGHGWMTRGARGRRG